jgi:hypothetical protein
MNSFLLDISFWKLAKHKICQVNCGKLLEMLLHQESFSILYFFFADGNHDPRVHIRGGKMTFAKILFLPSWFAKLLEANFSCFAKIRWMC